MPNSVLSPSHGTSSLKFHSELYGIGSHFIHGALKDLRGKSPTKQQSQELKPKSLNPRSRSFLCRVGKSSKKKKRGPILTFDKT